MSFSSICDRVLETLKRQQEPRTAAAIAAEAQLVPSCLPRTEPMAGDRLVGEALRTLEQAGLARRLGDRDDLWEATRSTTKRRSP